jgi:hypothetical protein
MCCFLTEMSIEVWNSFIKVLEKVIALYGPTARLHHVDCLHALPCEKMSFGAFLET